MAKKDALGRPIEKDQLYRCIMTGAVAVPGNPEGESFFQGMRLLGSHPVLQSSGSTFFVRDDTPDDEVPNPWGRLPAPNTDIGVPARINAPGGYGI